ncbi:hypothetical protein CYME_CMP171C [Cyanidioschyzon merolae strain 10D]|jgi:hypothetical protein|uniref:EF-hand domain-containing protein n=1 Tax=Cyanidioschyzon merolae (strain NIES-3377 / 10D) TaxID=280699 RepID=M1VFQ3_CYAM1|nr:hypothetical protein CYME_CMP171C [Cyanidioschyzon merolae strain 10D]BAM81802.1 hypothetical protein CYME_CMP171C [Cyanidioschyzon merolae strain 10D]|eukprot:XP_005537838.1 hypothetical protein CYME_CMP171C [Cyanidioschyzon merolae strain 10D]
MPRIKHASTSDGRSKTVTTHGKGGSSTVRSSRASARAGTDAPRSLARTGGAQDHNLRRCSSESTEALSDSDTSWKRSDAESADETSGEHDRSATRKRKQTQVSGSAVNGKRAVRGNGVRELEQPTAAAATVKTEAASLKKKPADSAKKLKASEVTFVFDELRNDQRFITPRQLMRAIMCQMGQQEAEQMTDSDITAMIRLADTNGDNRIDREEFENFVQREIRL